MAATRGALPLSLILLFLVSVTSLASDKPADNTRLAEQHPIIHSPRPFTIRRRISCPLRRQHVNWTKHGHTCYSTPDFRSTFDLTIYMDISSNPGPVHPSDCLRAIYLNARSLKALVPIADDCSTKLCKITILQLVHSGDFDIVCICETWLNHTVFDNEILPNYSIFRRDRKDRTGGGILVAVKSDIKASRRSDLEREGVELVVLELNKDHGKTALLYCFYHPDSVPEPILELNSSLLEPGESSCVIVIGDFNLPELDWSEDSCAPTNTGSRADHNAFCDLMGDNFLHQFVPGPTHIAGNKLDLLLCNCPEVIENVSTFHPREGKFPSDHYVIEFEIRHKFKRSRGTKRLVYDYKHGDFNALRVTLDRVPFNLAHSDDIDEYWTNWKDLFLSAVKEYIPVKTVRDKNSPPWIDAEIRCLIRKKYAALKHYRNNKTTVRKQKLREISQQIKQLIRDKHRQYLAKIENSFRDNPKLFWSYHKAFLGSKIGVKSVISYKGNRAEKPAHKAELLNEFFSSVFRPASLVNTDQICISNTKISDIEMSVDEMRNLLKSLDTSKACGPDGIPALLLKECCEQVAPSLCAIFNQSLSSSSLPTEWKSADIVPIHKKDSKEPAEHYRPISLLSINSKILERCVFTRLYDHLKCSITELQHGFLKNRSCVTQLLSALHAIGLNLDKNIQTDVVYLDFAKAFDSVDHKILLAKLSEYGVAGRLLSWLDNYLIGRVQRVVLEGAFSQWAPVTSGVPQGSLLGPLLFVLFINDLPDVVKSGVRAALYADDTKIFSAVQTIPDCVAVQDSLLNMDVWARRNNIQFNTSKCKVLTVTRKKQPLNYDYTLNHARLERVTEEKDLGVTVNKTLSWEKHVNSVAAKANKLLGLLKRTCPLLTDVSVRRKNQKNP